MPGHLKEHKGERATFGMGCFWAGDALFGATPGVLRTCVGYAGGKDESPTYKKIGDHTEVIDVEFDPEIVSFNDLLSLFWNNHEYGLTAKIKRQYTSLILYHTEEQRLQAEASMKNEQLERSEEFVTEIKSFEKFYPAEDYHQKYRLQSLAKGENRWILESTGLIPTETLITSTLASKLNGYIAGAVTVDQFEKELPSLGLDENVAQFIKKSVIANQGVGLYC